ncbi:MAG: GRP family sugar transporter [Verrucomicrobiae bacterium]|nr:GRP family sugar transporter [Verrucomicrobiae bacterium]
MTHSPHWPLILGGVIPALLLGVFSILVKASGKHGMGTAPFLMAIGLSIALSAGLAWWFNTPKTCTAWGLTYTILAGIIWAVSQMMILYSINHYGVPVSKLVPLFNMNTLVAVVLGLLIFVEWKDVNLWQLGLGAILVTVGGILVARA